MAACAPTRAADLMRPAAQLRGRQAAPAAAAAAPAGPAAAALRRPPPGQQRRRRPLPPARSSGADASQAAAEPPAATAAAGEVKAVLFDMVRLLGVPAQGRARAGGLQACEPPARRAAGQGLHWAAPGWGLHCQEGGRCGALWYAPQAGRPACGLHASKRLSSPPAIPSPPGPPPWRAGRRAVPQRGDLPPGGLRGDARAVRAERAPRRIPALHGAC